ncbi:MAG: helicase-related protein [Candidatus Jordarchaeales archaeon]|nr:DEAD/DEAH box helicase [Candidatus Jordarchaeia archaeon]
MSSSSFEAGRLASLAGEAGVFRGESVLVVAPPGSGKTWLGLEVAAGRAMTGGRSAYLSPLRALASECYGKLRGRGVEALLATGDYHLPLRGEWRVLVSTYERFDSLWRRGEVNVDTVVVDEVHVVGEGRRGARLECLLCRLRDEGVQVVALTATMGNPEEVAEWLGAKLVKVSPRPVSPSLIVCRDKNAEVARLVGEAVREGKQVIVFVSRRRSAESLAAKLAGKTKNFGGSSACLSLPAGLTELAEKGVCYHHAGLPGSVRRAVEEAFRKGELRVLVSTTTLSAGVNIPADVVVVRDLTVYDREGGAGYIDRNTMHQLLGRAGRFREGEAFILCSSNAERGVAMKTYFDGSIPVAQRVRSTLEQFLDEQVLVEVYRRGAASIDDLQTFLEGTLWWKQRRGEEGEVRVKPLGVASGEGWVEGFFKAHRCRVELEPLKATCTCNMPQPCPHVRAVSASVGLCLSNPIRLVVERLFSQGFLERVAERYTLTVFGAVTVKLYLTCEAALLLRRLVGRCRGVEEVKSLAVEALRETGSSGEGDLPWMLYCVEEVARIEGAVDAMAAARHLRTSIQGEGRAYGG